MKGFTKEVLLFPLVFQNVFENAQGGFRLNASALPAGATVKAGTAVGYNEATRTASVVKLATVHANAGNTATDIQVQKGHHFKLGDNLAKTVGGSAYAITAIDNSNADYDVLTVGTTLGVALSAGDVLFQSSASGANAAAYAVTANGLLYQDAVAETGADVTVVIRGTVYERRIPAVTAVVKAALPNIIFSQSF